MQDDVLRGFDQECREFSQQQYAVHGMKMHPENSPNKIEHDAHQCWLFKSHATFCSEKASMSTLVKSGGTSPLKALLPKPSSYSLLSALLVSFGVVRDSRWCGWCPDFPEVMFSFCEQAKPCCPLAAVGLTSGRSTSEAFSGTGVNVKGLSSLTWTPRQKQTLLSSACRLANGTYATQLGRSPHPV